MAGGGLDTMATLVWLRQWWQLQVFRERPKKTVDPAGYYFDMMVSSIPGIEQFPATVAVVNYGQKSFEQEREAVERAINMLFNDWNRIDVRLVYVNTRFNMIDRFNPGGGMLFGTGLNSKLRARNLSLAMEATAAFYPDTIRALHFCFTRETDVEMPLDTRPEFITALDRVMRSSELADGVYSTLLALDKMVALKQARIWWPKLFEVAFSCWLPTKGKPCGHCRHCVRFKMFEEATR